MVISDLITTLTCIVPGLVLLGLAAFFSYRDLGFRRRAERAAGTVIRLETKTGTDSRGSHSTSYVPVIKFRTSAGREVEYTGKIGTNPPAHKVGQQIQMLYDPQALSKSEGDSNQGAIKMDTFWGQYTTVVIFGVLGIILVVVGMVSIIGLYTAVRFVPGS